MQHRVAATQQEQRIETRKVKYLCTDAAKDLDMIEWAHGRAKGLQMRMNLLLVVANWLLGEISKIDNLS